MELHPMLWVAFGGAIGSLGRYLIAKNITQQFLQWRFPMGTFCVNVLGCLIIGLIAGYIVKQELFSPNMRLFLITGILGGFTTFSAFSLETFYLLQRGEFLIAISYVMASILVGLAFLYGAFLLIPFKSL